MTSRILIIIVALFAIPSIECQAQKLKFPNFAPFKKKSKEVKPFELTDRGQAANKKKNQLFDFLKPRNKNKNSNAMDDFNTRSKNFLDKTGSGFEKFSSNTRKFFDDAWNPPKAHKAWWNQGPKEFQSGPQTPSAAGGYSWPGARQAQQGIQPPPMPGTRSARHYQNGQPRHRFK